MAINATTIATSDTLFQRQLERARFGAVLADRFDETVGAPRTLPTVLDDARLLALAELVAREVEQILVGGMHHGPFIPFGAQRLDRNDPRCGPVASPADLLLADDRGGDQRALVAGAEPATGLRIGE